MKYILFDVGANWGVDSLSKTLFSPNIETWAFEPTPELIGYLTHHSRDCSDRYHVVPIALSDFDGISQFNIADNPGSDWGCSSLNSFSDNLTHTWPGRTDLKFNRFITVNVSRFDTWYNTNNINIDKIDFFHCDTQGSDLKVLKGMGDYIQLIQQGMVECARDESVKLYKENHTLEEMKDFLNENGFEVFATTPNDGFLNEFNVEFRKK